MQALNLPAFPFKIIEEEGKRLIFDPIRKQYLLLTPEEWVRQHFLQFLVKEKGFPAGLFSIERKVLHHQRSGRYDALCMNRMGKPFFLVECKAPGVSIGAATFDQVLRYNHSIGAPYLALTNGLEHFVMRVDFQERAVIFLEDIPDYQYLVSIN
jgi:hypothetical protein